MKYTSILTFLLFSWVSAQTDEPTGAAPSAKPIINPGGPMIPYTGQPEEEETAGTVDPKQPLNVDAPISMCRPNETYRVCGTACELTCDNPLPVPCVSRCVRGCQCNSGYYRNQRGECVRLADCPPKVTCATIRCQRGYVCQIIQGKPQCVPQCKPNESYLQCGSACEPSCDKPIPGVCTLQCVVGCQCNSGYYRNKQGNCVRLSECPPGPITCANILCMRGYICKESNGKAECVPTPQCKANESYLTCGTACEPSCDNPNPTVCTDNCVAGCQCDRGYYRNKLLGSCVLLKDCPPRCKANESYHICGRECEPSCDKPNPTGCSDNCITGCLCDSGYYRDKQGNCIRLADCPPSAPVCNLLCTRGYVCKIVQGRPQCVPDVPQCKPNESYKTCGTACELTCDKPTPGICPDHCVVGCQCNTGYYRNKNGDCVRLADCPKNPTCKANEVFTQCKSACEPSCDKPNPTICPDICAPGCQCVKDYYRNSNGDCVRLNQCPPKEPAACQGKQCTTPGGCALVIPITCIIGFCTPQPTCVNSNPCASTTCEVGKECVLRQVICIFPPCNPSAQCVAPSNPTCGQNEQQVSCKNACSERTCGQTPPIFCPPICVGSPGCACKSGYLRNSSGRCVTQQQC